MKKLEKNDYIGVISSSGFLKERNKCEFEESIKLINEIGLNVKLGKYIYENTINNVVKNKVSDLSDMVSDKDVKMIILKMYLKNM